MMANIRQIKRVTVELLSRDVLCDGMVFVNNQNTPCAHLGVSAARTNYDITDFEGMRHRKAPIVGSDIQTRDVRLVKVLV